MKEIFLNTQKPQYNLVYQEIKHLLGEYDHVRVENRLLRMTWNFYKTQKIQEPIIVEKEPVVQIKQVSESKVIQPEVVLEQKEPLIEKKFENTSTKNKSKVALKNEDK